MEKKHPHLGIVDEILFEKWSPFGRKAKATEGPFQSTFENFYLSNVISRASQTMARCVKDIVEVQSNSQSEDKKKEKSKKKKKAA